MANYYVISSGSYSDYRISFIIKSPNKIPREQFRKLYLESIRQSSDFDDAQLEKLRKHLEEVEIGFRKNIRSTNYFVALFDGTFEGGNNPSHLEISYENWGNLLKEVGVENNPANWFEKILAENGCEVLAYDEFNTDEWD